MDEKKALRVLKKMAAVQWMGSIFMKVIFGFLFVSLLGLAGIFVSAEPERFAHNLETVMISGLVIIFVASLWSLAVGDRYRLLRYCIPGAPLWVLIDAKKRELLFFFEGEQYRERLEALEIRRRYDGGYQYNQARKVEFTDEKNAHNCWLQIFVSPVDQSALIKSCFAISIDTYDSVFSQVMRVYQGLVNQYFPMFNDDCPTVFSTLSDFRQAVETAWNEHREELNQGLVCGTHFEVLDVKLEMVEVMPEPAKHEQRIYQKEPTTEEVSDADA